MASRPRPDSNRRVPLCRRFPDLSGTGSCVPLTGVEPATYCFGGSRAIRCATGARAPGVGGHREQWELRDSNPLSTRQLGYSQPRLSNVGALPWGDWSVPTRLPPGSRPGALPMSYSHHVCLAYPRRGSNPRSSVCGTDALPLSYTGRSRGAPRGDRTRRGRFIRAISPTR